MTHPNNIKPISTLDVPEVEPYRTLRRSEAHLRQGIFVAEGTKVVRRLLDSGLETLSLLHKPAWLERLLDETAPGALDDIRIYLAEEPLLRQIVGYNIHEGIMAIGKVPPEGTK